MKAARHMGGKVPGFKRGGMIDKGREEDEEKEMESGMKRGGAAKKRRASGGAAEGAMAGKRYDRPGRKSGGGVGSDKRPLTSASTTKAADGHADGVNETAPE